MSRGRLVPATKKRKPCVECGCQKRKGHPLWCDECWMRRQPVEVRHWYAARRLAAVPSGARRDKVEQRPRGRQWCRGCQTFVLAPQDAKPGAIRCNTCTSTAAHRGMVERVYGTDYDRMFKRQGGRCAGCGGRPRTKRLAVDHDHKSGKNRGLLCQTCNFDILGPAERLANPVETLRRLADYLEHGGFAGMTVGYAPRAAGTLELIGAAPDPAPLADCPF
jgi:hypothetical protein